jgi:hypothetical protein
MSTTTTTMTPATVRKLAEDRGYRLEAMDPERKSYAGPAGGGKWGLYRDGYRVPVLRWVSAAQVKRFLDDGFEGLVGSGAMKRRRRYPSRGV